jgi:hypothetical protein
MTPEWVGPPDLHDAIVREISRTGDELLVKLQSFDGAELSAVFTGVESVFENEPIGMMIYGLLARDARQGRSVFVFANWDDDDPASLEIMAKAVSFGELGPRRSPRI